MYARVLCLSSLLSSKALSAAMGLGRSTLRGRGEPDLGVPANLFTSTGARVSSWIAEHISPQIPLSCSSLSFRAVEGHSGALKTMRLHALMLVGLWGVDTATLRVLHVGFGRVTRLSVTWVVRWGSIVLVLLLGGLWSPLVTAFTRVALATVLVSAAFWVGPVVRAVSVLLLILAILCSAFALD